MVPFPAQERVADRYGVSVVIRAEAENNVRRVNTPPIVRLCKAASLKTPTPGQSGRGSTTACI